MRAENDSQAGAVRDHAHRYWRTANGLRLYARDYPGADGEARLPLVCLHGLTRNSKDFASVAAWAASTGRRVIVPEMRGRGRSEYDARPANYTPRTYARDVIGFMASLGVDRAIFLGTSMGGLIAMLLAAMRPKLVAAAILNDVGPEIAPAGIERIAAYVGTPAQVATWDEAVAYARRIGEAAYPAYQEEDWHRVARAMFREDERGLPAFDYDPRIALPLKTRIPKTSRLVAWFLFGRLARKRPTLLIRGEISDIVTREIADRMQRKAPSLEVVEVPGVGHAPTLEEPEARMALTRFLAAAP